MLIKPVAPRASHRVDEHVLVSVLGVDVDTPGRVNAGALGGERWNIEQAEGTERAAGAVGPCGFQNGSSRLQVPPLQVPSTDGCGLAALSQLSHSSRILLHNQNVFFPLYFSPFCILTGGWKGHMAL